MVTLLLILALIFAGLSAVVALTTVWWQSYFYEQTVGSLTYRVLGVAAALTAYLGIWSSIESARPGLFDSPFSFSAREVRTFDHFWAEKKTEAGITETRFERRPVPPQRFDYFDAGGRAWKRSDSGIVTAIIVEDDGVKQRFVAKLDESGNFLRDRADPNRSAEVEYVEDGGAGRVMSEYAIGTLASTRLGPIFLNLAFALVHLLFWFALLWFALEFQWPHALLLAGFGWLAATLFLWPALKTQVHALPAAAVVEAGK